MIWLTKGLLEQEWLEARQEILDSDIKHLKQLILYM